MEFSIIQLLMIFVAKNARGDYFLFLNNDITVITPDWMEEMLGVCQRREVGAVGVKLLYPDNTIQHAGCVVGMGGIAGHMFVDMPAEQDRISRIKHLFFRT